MLQGESPTGGVHHAPWRRNLGPLSRIGNAFGSHTSRHEDGARPDGPQPIEDAGDRLSARAEPIVVLGKPPDLLPRLIPAKAAIMTGVIEAGPR